MAEFKPFNYGKAIEQGQQNALRSVQMKEIARNVQGQNALGQLAQQNVTGADKYNALAMQGRPDLARNEQAKDLSMESAKYKFVSDSSRRVYNQQTYDAYDELMVRSGLAQPGEIKAQYGNEYSLSVQNGFKAMRGEADKKIDGLKKITMGTSDKPGWFTDTLYQGNEKVRESAPYQKIQNIRTAQVDGFGKPATNDIEKQLADSIQLKDRVTTAANFFMENQDLFDAGTQVAAFTGNIMEFVGMDAPEYLKNDLERLSKLNTYSKELVNSIRKAVTGSQASFAELDNFILPMVRRGTDGRTQGILRMQGLVRFNEQTTVRLKRLLAQGYKVASKPGDRSLRLRDENGKISKVENLQPLRAVRSYEDRMTELLEKSANGRPPQDFTPEEQQILYDNVIQKMGVEGYNIDVPRDGWK